MLSLECWCTCDTFSDDIIKQRKLRFSHKLLSLESLHPLVVITTLVFPWKPFSLKRAQYFYTQFFTVALTAPVILSYTFANGTAEAKILHQHKRAKTMRNHMIVKMNLKNRCSSKKTICRRETFICTRLKSLSISDRLSSESKHTWNFVIIKHSGAPTSLIT